MAEQKREWERFRAAAGKVTQFPEMWEKMHCRKHMTRGKEQQTQENSPKRR